MTKPRKRRKAFLLIEVLVALAIFGICATSIVSTAFEVMQFLNRIKDTREQDQDLQFARAKVLSTPDRTGEDSLEEGGTIETLSLGPIEWTMQDLEMTDILDVYKVTILFQWDGNEDVNAGEELITAHVLRPTWTTEEFQTQRIQNRTEKELKIDEMLRERNP